MNAKEMYNGLNDAGNVAADAGAAIIHLLSLVEMARNYLVIPGCWDKKSVVHELEHAIGKYDPDRYHLVSFPQVSIVLRDYTGTNLWSVEWLGFVLTRSGKWIHNPLPSSRTPAFKKRTRFPLDEAVVLAIKKCSANREQYE